MGVYTNEWSLRCSCGPLQCGKPCSVPLQCPCFDVPNSTRLLWSGRPEAAIVNMDGGAGSPGGVGRTSFAREGDEVRCSGKLTFQGSPGELSKPTTSSSLPSLTALLANESRAQDVRPDDEAVSSPTELRRSNNDNAHWPWTPRSDATFDTLGVNPRAPCCGAHPRHL